MSMFTIAYVPTVEEVLKVNTVDVVRKVEEVDKVNDVRKLPHPYFPLKKYNFQKGGQLHITPTMNMYQAVYIPENEVELKGVQLCFTSYNIEDKYDVMIGSRFIIKDSYVKEMTEYRMFEVYEVVPAGTPITINYYNNSGLEKFMMYELIMLIDQKVFNITSNLNWTFNWNGGAYHLGSEDVLNLIISQPNYVNMDSRISSFSLNVFDIRTQANIANITYNGNINSTYIETVPDYIPLSLLARVNIIGITAIQVFEKSISILFKNLSNITSHPIEIGITGNVVNTFI